MSMSHEELSSSSEKSDKFVFLIISFTRQVGVLVTPWVNDPGHLPEYDSHNRVLILTPFLPSFTRSL